MNLANRVGVATSIGAALLTAVLLSSAVAQQAGEGRPASSPADFGKQLVAAVKSVEGCLGADAGQMAGGKLVVMAWFKDKAAVLRWHQHPMHQRFLALSTTPSPEPLAKVPADVPVMVIASIAMSRESKIPNSPLPIASISIELYTPLSGGAYINERLSPEAFPIPDMKSIKRN